MRTYDQLLCIGEGSANQTDIAIHFAGRFEEIKLVRAANDDAVGDGVCGASAFPIILGTIKLKLNLAIFLTPYTIAELF